MEDYRDRAGIADEDVPSFHLQERVADSTTEVTKSVGLDGNDNLEEVTCPND